MENYTLITNYECPECQWSLNVEKDVWEKFPNMHEQILQYIEEKVVGHGKEFHNISSYTLYKQEELYKSIDSMKNSEYFITPDIE